MGCEKAEVIHAPYSGKKRVVGWHQEGVPQDGQEEKEDTAGSATTQEEQPRVPRNTPQIILPQDEDPDAEETPGSVSKRQQRRKNRRKRRTKKPRGETDHSTNPKSRSGGDVHSFSDTELPALESHHTENNLRAETQYPEKSTSSLSLPPMPLGVGLTHRPSCLGPLHNVPPPSASQESPRRRENAKRTPHPFLRHRGVDFSDFNLKNSQLGMNMFKATKEMHADECTKNCESTQHGRHLSSGLNINLPSLTGVASGARLV